MAFLYLLGMAIGSNWIMILCVIIGCLLAKKGKVAWVFYWIGTILTVLSVLGMFRQSSMYGSSNSFPVLYCLVFVVIALVGASLIRKRSE